MKIYRACLHTLKKAQNMKNQVGNYFLDSISFLTEQTFLIFHFLDTVLNLPYGFILIKDSKPLTFEFTICTLLKRVNLKSLLHSSSANEVPSRSLLNCVKQDVLEEMLLVSDPGKTGLQKLLMSLKIVSLSKTTATSLVERAIFQGKEAIFERFNRNLTSMLYNRSFSNI